LKIDIPPYLSEKSSDYDEILYTATDFELDERNVIKYDKVALDRLRIRQNVFLAVNESHNIRNKPVYNCLDSSTYGR